MGRSFKQNLNLFTNLTELIIRNKIFNIVLFLYEFLPLMIYAGDLPIFHTHGQMNILYYSNYLSMIYHIEFLNSKFNSTCESSFVISNNNLIESQQDFMLNQLFLDKNTCNFSNTLLYFAYTIILFASFSFFYISKINLKEKHYSKYLNIFLRVLVNLIIFATKICSMFFFEIFINLIITFFFKITTQSNQIHEYFLFAISSIFLIFFSIMTVQFQWRFSAYLEDYPWDYKICEFEILILILKFLISFDVSLRKLRKLEKLFFINFMFTILSILSLYRELFNHEYVTNLFLNNLKQTSLIMVMLITVFKYLNHIINLSYLDISMQQCPLVIFEIIFVMFIGLFWFIYRYRRDTMIESFFSHSGNVLDSKTSIDRFLIYALRLGFNYIYQLNKEKISVLGTNKISQIQDYTNSLNSHIWSCDMKNYKKKDNLAKECPICLIGSIYILNNQTHSKHSTIETNQNNIIIICILKFLKLIGKSSLIKKINFVDYFMLKFMILDILDGKKCNRVLIFTTQFERLWKNSFKVILLSKYLKQNLKKKYKENFIDYDNFQIEEVCIRKFKTQIANTSKFIDNLVEKNMDYKFLLRESLKIGENHSTIRSDINLLSKTIKAENKLTFVMFLTSYKFIFNEVYDKYLSNMYDINDCISQIEHKFLTDSILMLDYDMDKNTLVIKKIPTNTIFMSIFEESDLSKNFQKFFFSYLRSIEIEKFIKKVLKSNSIKTTSHKEETISSVSSLIIKDKKQNIVKINLRIKLLLNISNSFKINCFLDIPKDEGLIIIDSTGKILSTSKGFSNKLLITSELLSRYPNVNIKNFLPSFILPQFLEEDFIFNEENKPADQYFIINFEDYTKVFDLFLSSSEEKNTYFSNEELINFHNIQKQEDKAYIFKVVEIREYINEKIIIYQIEEKAVVNKANQGKMLSKFIKNKNSTDNNKNDDKYEEGSAYNYLDKLEEYDLAFTDSSASVISQSLQKKEMRFISKDSNQFSEYIKNSKDLTKICYYIIIINIIIVVIGIAFLFIIKARLDSIQGCFYVFQTYKLVYSRTYINTLGFISLLSIKESDGSFKENDFPMNKLRNDENIKMDFPLFVSEDINSKINILSNNIKSFQSAAYTYLAADFINDQVNLPGKWFTFQTNNNPKGYQDSDTHFFQMIELFVNSVQAIAQNKAIYIAINPISIANDKNFLKFFNYDLSLEKGYDIEKVITTLMINLYPNLDKNLGIIFTNLGIFQASLITDLSNTIVYCLVTLISLELVIVFLTFFLIKIYIKQTTLVMSLILSLKAESLQIILKKLKYVGKFLNLAKNPMKTLKKLKKIMKVDKKKGNDGNENTYLHRKKMREKQLQEEAHGKYKNLDSVFMNSQINDEYYISRYLNKISFSLLIGMISYFIFCYFQSANTINGINKDFEFMSYYFQDLQYTVRIATYIKTALFLNKTNIPDDYFLQQINTDYFEDKSQDFYMKLQKVQALRYENYNSLILFNNFLQNFQGEKICPFLVDINRPLLDTTLTASVEDISSTLLYLCKKRDIMKTDLYSINAFINNRIRTIIEKFKTHNVNQEYIKELVDSEYLYELIEIAMFYIRPLYMYTHSYITTPTFVNDLNTLFVFCIVIFVMNILLNIFFLIVSKKMILDKIVRNVENLNILLKILS
jgi:hypothetical protein